MAVFFKLLATVPLLLTYAFLSGVISFFPVGASIRRTLRTRSTSFFSRRALAIFGIRVHVKHRERLRKHAGAPLIVSNHLSYLDALIIASLAPSVFITSVELQHTPLLGTLARFGGSLFVERRKPSGLKREIEAITEVLRQGAPVVLFPEGTTSNGDRVQPFKNSLFDAAIAARAEILPVCIRYTGVNGERLTPRNRDSVFYYGGITFQRHFPKLLKLKSINVEVAPLKSISAQAHHSRKDLAAEAHRVISSAYHG